MKVLGVCVLVVLAGVQFGNVQAAELRSHLRTGVEYHFATSSDIDNAPGGYVNYEIEFPQPISAVVGLTYFGGDYALDVPEDSYVKNVNGVNKGSYDSIGLELLLIGHWNYGMLRPYCGAGGAQYFNSFDNIDFSDQIGMIFCGGTDVQVTDSIRANFGLRWITLQPNHLDVKIGDINMDAVVLRAGLTFDF